MNPSVPHWNFVRIENRTLNPSPSSHISNDAANSHSQLSSAVQSKSVVCCFCKRGPHLNSQTDLFASFRTSKGDVLYTHYYCAIFCSNMRMTEEKDPSLVFEVMEESLLEKEYYRGSRLRCSFCKKTGCTIGCVVKSCPCVFHYGCGLEKGALFKYYERHAYCSQHRPLPSIKKLKATLKLQGANLSNLNFAQFHDNEANIFGLIDAPHTNLPLSEYTVSYKAKFTKAACMTKKVSPLNCVICFGDVRDDQTYGAFSGFRSPCCSDSWFHVSCIQRMASESKSLFACPTCKNKNLFVAVCKDYAGIDVVEGDPSWALDSHYADIDNQGHEAALTCQYEKCACPKGPMFSGRLDKLGRGAMNDVELTVPALVEEQIESGMNFEEQLKSVGGPMSLPPTGVYVAKVSSLLCMENVYYHKSTMDICDDEMDIDMMLRGLENFDDACQSRGNEFSKAWEGHTNTSNGKRSTPLKMKAIVSRCANFEEAWLMLKCDCCGQNGGHVFCEGLTSVPSGGWFCKVCGTVKKYRKIEYLQDSDDDEDDLAENPVREVSNTRKVTGKSKKRKAKDLCLSDRIKNVKLLLEKTNLSVLFDKF